MAYHKLHTMHGTDKHQLLCIAGAINERPNVTLELRTCTLANPGPVLKLICSYLHWLPKRYSRGHRPGTVPRNRFHFVIRTRFSNSDSWYVSTWRGNYENQTEPISTWLQNFGVSIRLSRNWIGNSTLVLSCSDINGGIYWFYLIYKILLSRERYLFFTEKGFKLVPWYLFSRFRYEVLYSQFPKTKIPQ